MAIIVGREAKRGNLVMVTYRAAEDICTGDYCRLTSDGKARPLRDGDGLKATDFLATSDAKKDEVARLYRIDPLAISGLKG